MAVYRVDTRKGAHWHDFVKAQEQWSLPSVVCDHCSKGEGAWGAWGASGGYYHIFSDVAGRPWVQGKYSWDQRSPRKPIGPAEYMQLADTVARDLGIERNHPRLWPSTSFGPAALKLIARYEHTELIQRFAGEFYVTRKLLDAMTHAGFNGFNAHQVIWADTSCDADLHRLEIIGVAPVTDLNGDTLEVVVDCSECGRKEYRQSLAPPQMRPDIKYWSKHDLFVPDVNPNTLYLTERAAEVFAAHIDQAVFELVPLDV